MDDASAASRTSKEPFGWWKGLAFTLGAGTALASFPPCALILTYFANLLLNNLNSYHDPSVSLWPNMQAVGLVLVIFPAMTFAIFAFVVIPITLSYAIVRWVAGHLRLTLLRRAAIGLLLGVGAETAMPAFLSTHGSAWHRIMTPRNSNDPLIVAVFTGLTLGALIRPRWLGLSGACGTPPEATVQNEQKLQ